MVEFTNLLPRVQGADASRIRSERNELRLASERKGRRHGKKHQARHQEFAAALAKIMQSANGHGQLRNDQERADDSRQRRAKTEQQANQARDRVGDDQESEKAPEFFARRAAFEVGI